MNLFSSKKLRQKKFFTAIHYFLSLVVVFNMSAVGTLIAPKIALADSNTPVSVSASYNPRTHVLSVSGDHYRTSWLHCYNEYVGFATFIDSETPKNSSSLDDRAHLLPTPCITSGSFAHTYHHVYEAPSNVCVAIYDIEEDKIGSKGDYSDLAAGHKRNKDNSFDNEGKIFPEGSCVVPTIIDDVAPVLTLSDNITTPATSVSGAPVSYTATATDAVDGPIVPVCSPILSGGIFPIGVTTVSCSATDSSNNTANGSFSVTVTSAPALTLTKTANKTTAMPGDAIRYTVHVANSGTGSANGVAVSDSVPSSLTITGASCAASSGATCAITPSINPITATGNLASGSYFDVFVDVKVASGTTVGLLKNTVGVIHEETDFQTTATDAGVTILAAPVVLNATPVANAHGPYTGTLSGGTVQIDLVGTGTDTDGTIVKYEWDFDGNGTYDAMIPAVTPATTGSVSHAYTAVGTYHPVLRVTDNQGAVDTDVTIVTISAHGPAVSLNVAPDISNVTADDTLPLVATAKDALGNTWDATSATTFTENDPCGTVSGAVYNPCQGGNWEIVGTYSGLSDTTLVHVSVGTLHHIVVTPNTKPEVIDEGKSRDFNAKGYDADNNEITPFHPTWSTTGEIVAIGTINQNGLFAATHGGIGRVTATSGVVSASVGVVVKQVKKSAVVTLPEPSTGGTGTGGDDETTPPAEEVPPADDEGTLPDENEQTDDEGTVAGETASDCTTWPWWVWYLLTAGYIVFLVAYYMNLQRLEKNHGLVRNWWAVPLLLTAILLVLYFLYRCPDVFLRWPWVLILSGVIVSAIYYQSRESDEMPTSGSSQTPTGGQIKSI